MPLNRICALLSCSNSVASVAWCEKFLFAGRAGAASHDLMDC